MWDFSILLFFFLCFSGLICLCLSICVSKDLRQRRQTSLFAIINPTGLHHTADREFLGACISWIFISGLSWGMWEISYLWNWMNFSKLAHQLLLNILFNWLSHGLSNGDKNGDKMSQVHVSHSRAGVTPLGAFPSIRTCQKYKLVPNKWYKFVFQLGCKQQVAAASVTRSYGVET